MGAQEQMTDLGNARRLVAAHGDDLRYVPAWAAWLVWDGRRWVQDTTGEVVRRAKATVREMLRAAVELPDPKAREALAKHALCSESRRALDAMVALATTEPGVPVEPADLDSDPWLLCCTNGTLDLRTCELREHRREDLMTRCTAAPYELDAYSPTLARVVERALPDAAVQAFVRRAFGYSLVGAQTEECFFFVHGPPASAKSTILEAIKTTLGDYAATADFTSFLQRRDVGSPRPDLARLAGVRFVASVEVDDGARLASGLVKMLTGGDTVTARFLYGRDFEFRPAFTLWLAANDEPRVRDDDAALWRRIHEVPFAVSIPEAERDPSVKAELTDAGRSGAAVLAWMVAGLADYLDGGLRVPDAVRSATRDYRARMDPLADWWTECIVEEPTGSATAAELYRSYAAWCEAAGIRKPMARRALGMRVTARGYSAQPDKDHTRLGLTVRS